MPPLSLSPASTAAPIDPALAAGAGLRTFFNMADAWQLTVPEQMTLLGIEARSTFFALKKKAAASRTVTGVAKEMRERLSYLLGIYKALQILFPDAAFADAWVRRANTAALFGGKSALDRMLSGHVADLYIVRQYLDGQRSGIA